MKFSFQMETSQKNWVNYALVHLYLIFTFSQIGKLLRFVETPQLVSFELLDFWALIEMCINSLHNTRKKNPCISSAPCGAVQARIPIFLFIASII